jgi:ATP-dependent protease Clp ATPase subunit
MATLWRRRCSFCKKSDAEVSKLVAGPRVLICDECVAVASRLMQDPPAPEHGPERLSAWHRVTGAIRRLLHVHESHGFRSTPTS